MIIEVNSPPLSPSLRVSPAQQDIQSPVKQEKYSTAAKCALVGLAAVAAVGAAWYLSSQGIKPVNPFLPVCPLNPNVSSPNDYFSVGKLGQGSSTNTEALNVSADGTYDARSIFPGDVTTTSSNISSTALENLEHYGERLAVSLAMGITVTTFAAGVLKVINFAASY